MSSRRAFLRQLAAGALAAAAGGVGLGARRGDSVSLCVFSKHLEWLDYGATAETAAELGFDGVVLTVRPGGHVEPVRAAEDLPRAAEAIEAAGLELPMITTAIRRADGPHAETILRTARELGVEYYRMGYYFYDEPLRVGERLEELAPRMRDLAALNEEIGLHGAYENHAGREFVGAVLWDLWELLRDLDPRWIGCELDVRHAMVATGDSWPIQVGRLAPYVRTITAKDFRWVGSEEGPVSGNCPIGEGRVPWSEYLGLLAEIEFSGPCSMHFEYPLGGANHGDEEISIPPERVRSALRRDRARLAELMTKAGLRA